MSKHDLDSDSKHSFIHLSTTLMLVQKSLHVWSLPLTIRAQIPLTLSAGLSLWVRLHSNSITPDSRMGCTHTDTNTVHTEGIQSFVICICVCVCTSLLGENSSSRLHSVEEAMTRTSSGAFCNSCIQQQKQQHTTLSVCVCLFISMCLFIYESCVSTAGTFFREWEPEICVQIFQFLSFGHQQKFCHFSSCLACHWGIFYKASSTETDFLGVSRPDKTLNPSQGYRLVVSSFPQARCVFP